MSTLCVVPASMLLKSMVKACPVGAARHFWSKATPIATTDTVVPEGVQVAPVVGAIDGWESGGVVNASAKPPAAEVATLRLALLLSNQATARCMPFGDTARAGLVP